MKAAISIFIGIEVLGVGPDEQEARRHARRTLDDELPGFRYTPADNDPDRTCSGVECVDLDDELAALVAQETEPNARLACLRALELSLDRERRLTAQR